MKKPMSQINVMDTFGSLDAGTLYRPKIEIQTWAYDINIKIYMLNKKNG